MQAGAVLQNASAADRREAVVRTCETLDQALDRAGSRSAGQGSTNCAAARMRDMARYGTRGGDSDNEGLDSDMAARARALREPTGYVQAVVDTIDQLSGGAVTFRVFPDGVFAYPPPDVPWERVDHRRYLKVGGIRAMLQTLPASVRVNCEDESAPFTDGAGNVIVESDDDEIRHKLLWLLLHKHRAYGDDASDAKLAAMGVPRGMRLWYDPQVGDEHWRGADAGPPGNNT